MLLTHSRAFARLFCLLLVTAFVSACGDDSATFDTLDQDTRNQDAQGDGSELLDAAGDAATDGQDDVALLDSLVDTFGDSADATIDAPDGGDEAFGTIAGPCGRLLAELDSPDPSFYSTRFDFMDNGYDDPEERPLLTSDAVTLLEAPNAGGSSRVSEAFALETLVRCDGAMLTHTENEIEYNTSDTSITDFRVLIDGHPIGVSVVRAFTFPLGSDYTVEQATEVIGGKLDDILESSANVSAGFEWDKQILAVLAPDDMPMESVMSAWEAMDGATRSDTIVYVIVTDGADEPIY